MNNLSLVNLPKKTTTHNWPKMCGTSYKFINLQQTVVYVGQRNLSLVYTLLEKGTIAYVPQRTTLTAKFYWGNRGALLSRGAELNGQFGKFFGGKVGLASNLLQMNHKISIYYVEWRVVIHLLLTLIVQCWYVFFYSKGLHRHNIT